MPRVLDDQAKFIIEKIPYATVATASQKRPWNTPVYCAFDEDYNFYWGAKAESQHSKDIRRSGQVFIVIYDSNTILGPETGVYIEAHCNELTGNDEIEHALGLIKSRRKPLSSWTANQIQNERSVKLYKAIPTEIWVEGAGEIGSTTALIPVGRRDAKSSVKSSSSTLDQIFAKGYAIIRLDSSQAQCLENLYREATLFFSQNQTKKLRYGVPNRTTGYRPYKYAYTGDGATPDLNDSFLYWHGKRDEIPHSAEIKSFLDAYEAYNSVAEHFVADLIRRMQAHYNYKHELPFFNASVMQINSYGVPTDEELLQHKHEDKVFLTLISTDSAGLEGFLEDEIKPFVFNRDEVLVMPGSIMTDMTGGEIPPLYHHARNHGNIDRKSVMYFVSPNVTNYIEPFVINDYNRAMNIRSRIINNPQAFGLSEEFISRS